MRKDLKIGMAIGAVLLVVLIVYLAVPNNPTGDVAQSDPVELQTDGSETGNSAAPEESTTPPAEQSTEPAGQSVATSDGASDRTTDVFSPDATATGTEDTATATAGGQSTNWDLLLTTGQIPSKTVTPSLRATNTVAPAGPADAPVKPAVAEVATDNEGTPIGTSTTDASDTAKPAVEESQPTTPASDETPASTVGDTAETTTTTAGGARTHKVKSGETFSSIAKAAYNDDRYLAIEAANPSVDPKRLRPGTVITLPDLSAAQTASAKITGGSTTTTEKTTTEKTARTIDPKSEYKVKRGDSLYKIAVEVYGSSNMVDDLYEANKQSIGADSAKLKLGMVLKLPPNPNAQASTR